MGELEEAHKEWLERKNRELKRLEEYMIAFDVAAMFTKNRQQKKFYDGARVAIGEAMTIIKNGEI